MIEIVIPERRKGRIIGGIYPAEYHIPEDPDDTLENSAQIHVKEQGYDPDRIIVERRTYGSEDVRMWKLKPGYANFASLKMKDSSGEIKEKVPASATNQRLRLVRPSWKVVTGEPVENPEISPLL